MATLPISDPSRRPRAATEFYRFGFALLLLLIGFFAVVGVCRPPDNYWLDGDGARYVQMAIQLVTFGRLGLMPEFGQDFSRIFPPLLPACIALAKQFTSDYYLASRTAITASLLLAILGAFFLARLLSRSALSALLAGLAVAFFLIPRNSTNVLTEPLSAALYLGGILAVLLVLRRKPAEAGGAWVYIAAALMALATLCRPQGATVGFGMAVGLLFTLSKAEMRERKRDLTIMGCGWLTGVLLYVVYDRYMRALGGVPPDTLLHAYAAFLHGSSRYWPFEYLDPKSGVVSLIPEAGSLWAMFREAPAEYVKISWITLKSCLTQWFVILLSCHILRLVAALSRRRTTWNLVLFCDVSLVATFLLNTALLCVVSQHPIFIPRMFDPWVVCSVTALSIGVGRLFQLPVRVPFILKAGSVAVALAAAGSQYGNLQHWVADTAVRHRGGVIPDAVIESIKKDVPPYQTIIGSPLGGPDIAVSIAGHPNMYFDGPPSTFRTQMRSQGILYALIATHVTPDARDFMPDCDLLFDYASTALFVCPPGENSGKAPSRR